MSNDLLTCMICGQYSGGYSCIILKAIQLCAATKGVVLGPFCSKNAGINVGHFGLESGLVFEEPTGAYA